jgi:hypothetical protein
MEILLLINNTKEVGETGPRSDHQQFCIGLDTTLESLLIIN